MKLANTVYLDDKAPVSALLGIFIKKYGTQALEWDPAIIRDEIQRDYDIKLSEKQSDKLHAGILVLTNDAFGEDAKVFEACCHFMSNVVDDLDAWHPLEVEEAVAGIAEATLIRGDGIQFGDEVRAYLGQLFYDYGFHRAPTLFPNAILPRTGDGSDEEKNEALTEVFDACLERVITYLDSLTE